MSINFGEQTVFDTLKKWGPQTKADLVDKTKFSEKSVRTYISALFEHHLIKELPNIGRTKLYAPIDYVPVIDESKPLAQRWQVYSKITNMRYTLGELAAAYGNGLPASSTQAAELLLKAPALLCYYAQETSMSDEELQSQLEALSNVLGDAIEQLHSAIGVFTQLRSDPRYWRPDLLRMLNNSPDDCLPRDIERITERLRSEQEDADGGD
jgi:hypothetical protein